MRLVWASLLLPMAALLGACGGSQTCNKVQPYETARSGQKIEAPDGLDDLQTNQAVEIPEASSRKERKEGDPCLDFPPVLRTGTNDGS